MHYVLGGKIAKAHPYQLDKTLTVDGAGAEAQATGKAINEAKKTATDHIDKTDNPHKVTKEQVGLGNVDNTSDSEKPVSKLQQEAIDNVQKKIAEEHIDNHDNPHNVSKEQVGLGNVDNTSDLDKPVSNLQQEAINEAKTAAESAYALANYKTSAHVIMLRLDPTQWSDNKQHITVEGLKYNDLVFLSPHTSSSDEYLKCGVVGLTMNADDICFKCNKVPTNELNVICGYFTLSVDE